MKNKKVFAGLILFIILIVAIIVIKNISDNDTGSVLSGKLTTVYVATGGGKEDFLNDKDVIKILRSKYKLNVVFDTWSNGKTITKPLIREYVGLGNKSIAEKMANGGEYTIHSDGVSTYDALFTSDQRFYDYYKLFPNKELGEADRYTVLDGGLTLNTPIVIYSWGKVVDALINENIVTETDGVYYITDMNKLIDYILEGKKWSDIGLTNLYGTINIASTDPVSSSPGATYYGLLLSILSEAQVTTDNIDKNLPKLKDFYIKSGYMNNTPADLFERYLKTGMGGEPMIVDYEKSMIDFANSSPDAFNQVKDDIRILYPTPTIWNSHCFTVFTDKGAKLYEALNDKEIGQIAWEKYGFRTGVTGGTYDVSSIGLGVPQTISSTVTSLKMDTYNKLIEYEKKIDEKSIEGLVNEKEITDNKIEKSLNYDDLSKEEKEAIEEFNKKFDVNDSTQILQFGVAAQEKISKFSDSILDDVKTKNTGEVGDLLADLVSQIKAFDKDVSGTAKKNFIEKIFSSAKKEFDYIVAKYSKIEKNIDTIEGGLEKDKLQMLKDITIFDTMYEKNLEYFKEISLYIIAGEKKLAELRETELPKLKVIAEKSGEQLDVQKVNDMEALINRFEKKIYDLKTTRIISIQMAPQIRLLQNNEAELVEKIQSSITNTIPLWKNQMVLALGISNAKNALKSQQAVSKLTNEMLAKNSETLKQGSVEIARESERAIVDVETLQKTNQDIIETLDEVIKIHEEGRNKRAEAEKTLEEIEKELKAKMLEIHVKEK